MNSSFRQVVGAGVLGATAAVSSSSASSLSVTDVGWEFYQGGYVQKDDETFAVHQDHFAGSPSVSVVSDALGGAVFESKASMTLSEEVFDDGLSFAATAAFELSASVDDGWLEGMAHAFGGLSAFTATVEIEDMPHVLAYSGPELWISGVGIVDGDAVLEPGTYQMSSVDAFPGGEAFWQTGWPGEGQSSTVTGLTELEFQFTAIPLPGPLAMALAGLAGTLGARGLITRRRREARLHVLQGGMP